MLLSSSTGVAPCCVSLLQGRLGELHLCVARMHLVHWSWVSRVHCLLLRPQGRVCPPTGWTCGVPDVMPWNPVALRPDQQSAKHHGHICSPRLP